MPQSTDPAEEVPTEASRTLLPELTTELDRSTPDLAAQLADEIRARVPRYRRGGGIEDDELRVACVAHIRFVAAVDRGGTPAQAEAEAIGAERARAEIGLSDVLDAVRVGSEFIWRNVVAYGRRSGTTEDAELVQVAGEVWAMSDDFAHFISAGYRRYERNRIIDGQRERYALIETVLSGHDQPAATLWQAIDRLGLPRERPFVVVAIATTGSVQIPAPRLDERLRAAAMESAWLLRADVELGVVSCRAEQVPVVRDGLSAFGVRAGISPVQADFGHMPQTVRLARTALAAAAPGEVALFADSAIGTMAAGAPDVAGELTAIVLDPVLELPVQERDVLLSTVQRWFDCGGSVARTASEMFVHPNTVRNRIRRVETLTRRTLADPRHAAEIYLTLVSLSMSARAR
jgi:hypothetical protein